MGGPIAIEQKRCEAVFHDHDLLGTNVRCKDLPNSA